MIGVIKRQVEVLANLGEPVSSEPTSVTARRFLVQYNPPEALRIVKHRAGSVLDILNACVPSRRFDILVEALVGAPGPIQILGVT